jgi:hypothetical protein
MQATFMRCLLAVALGLAVSCRVPEKWPKSAYIRSAAGGVRVGVGGMAAAPDSAAILSARSVLHERTALSHYRCMLPFPS